jgi:diguanylate cyclase (GGDEF)-like protein/PAS domain S-box-containing protein
VRSEMEIPPLPLSHSAGDSRMPRVVAPDRPVRLFPRPLDPSFRHFPESDLAVIGSEDPDPSYPTATTFQQLREDDLVCCSENPHPSLDSRLPDSLVPEGPSSDDTKRRYNHRVRAQSASDSAPELLNCSMCRSAVMRSPEQDDGAGRWPGRAGSVAIGTVALLVAGAVVIVAEALSGAPTLGVAALSAALLIGASAALVWLRQGARLALAQSDDRACAIEIAAQESARRYEMLFEHTVAGVYRATPEGRILECNSALSRLLGFERTADTAGHNAIEFYVDRDERKRFLAQLRSHGQLSGLEWRLQRKDGRKLWVMETTALESADPGAEVIVSSMVDVTERKLAQSQIEYQAYHDALTKLPNRAFFLDRLASAIPRAHRRRTGLGVLFMDLDRFKVVNDTLGHGAGDRLLRQVAERLRRSVREGDTVARIGGDEFTFLLESDVHAPQAAKVAQKLLARLAEPFAIDHHRLHVTASVGISLFPADGTDAESLLKSADVAMYRAKEVGRNGYQLASPELNARAVERLALEGELRSALEREEFVVHYQPVVSCANDQTTGFEALVRWQHPQNGLIGPQQFMPLAEELRLEIPVSEWVLSTACRQVRDWQERAMPHMRLAVNLSALHFQRDDLPARIESLLEETGFNPALFEVEITESAAMQNRERTADALTALRRMGIRISLDDFGTGQASFSYLQRFPLDALKIDRDFVRDIGLQKGGEAIVGAIIDLAHGLGLTAIAEGVENEIQLAFLRDKGCDGYQGYLYSPPVPTSAIDERLQRHAHAS